MLIDAEFHAVYARSVASAGTQRDDEPEDLIGTIQLEFTDWHSRRPAGSYAAIGQATLLLPT